MVDSRDILAAARQDPMLQDPSLWQLLEPFALVLPTTLNDLLEEKVTLGRLYEARTRVLLALAAEGSTYVTPRAHRIGTSSYLLRVVLRERADETAYLSRRTGEEEVPEARDAFLADARNLRPEVADAWRAGTLTFAELLKQQPGLVLTGYYE
jgi:hypothetical protein